MESESGSSEFTTIDSRYNILELLGKYHNFLKSSLNFADGSPSTDIDSDPSIDVFSNNRLHFHVFSNAFIKAPKCFKLTTLLHEADHYAYTVSPKNLILTCTRSQCPLNDNDFLTQSIQSRLGIMVSVH
ncbi:hypothetical protein YC2023_037221 [Brassica napus]